VSRTLRAAAADRREPVDYVSTTTYDARDRVTRSTSPRGNAMSFAYEDGTNRRTDTIRLDSAGNEVERQHLTLNAVGNKVREESQSCASPAPTCRSWVTKREEDYSYDS